VTEAAFEVRRHGSHVVGDDFDFGPPVEDSGEDEDIALRNGGLSAGRTKPASHGPLVFAGVFDRWPEIKIITHHMGAMAPYFEGRLGHGWDQLGTRSTGTDYAELRASLKKRPLDYFKQFYADTALFGSAAGTRCGLNFFGVDRVLFASDTPFEPEPGIYIRETINVIDALEITPKPRSHLPQKRPASVEAGFGLIVA